MPTSERPPTPPPARGTERAYLGNYSDSMRSIAERWMREYTFIAYTEDDPRMNCVSVSHSTCLWTWEVKTLPDAIHAVIAHHTTHR